MVITITKRLKTQCVLLSLLDPDVFKQFVQKINSANVGYVETFDSFCKGRYASDWKKYYSS